MTPIARKALWTTTVFVILALIGIPALVIYAPLYRSTTTVSLTGKLKFEQLTQEFAATPTTFPVLSRTDFEVKTTGDKFEVTYPAAADFKTWQPSIEPVIEIPQGKTDVELGPEKSPLKLVAMRVDYKTGPNPDDRFLGIYDPITLDPFADSDLIKRYRLDEVTGDPYRYGSPRLTFIYQPGVSQMHHVFDGRTYGEFNRQGTKAGDDFAMIHHTYSQWHSTPLKILANREHGKTVETPIRITEGYAFKGKCFQFSISLIEQLEHPIGGFGVRSIENPQTFSARIDATREHPVLIIFLSFTEMKSKPENAKLHIELDDGRIVSQRLTFSQQVTPLSFGGVHRSKIKRAWVSEPPQNSSVLFQIHGVPGLPVENEGLTNFFDAKIPFTNSPRSAIPYFIGTASQVQATQITWNADETLPDHDYFENIHLHEIVELIENDPAIFRLGIESDELVSYGTPLEKLKRSFRTFR